MTKTTVEPDLETDEQVLRALDVTVLGHGRPLLAPTSLILRSGDVVVAVGEPGHHHTALALALGGRLRTDGGTVTLDRAQDARSLRRAVALVDVPRVSEPDGALSLLTVVGEEMSMAGLRAGRRAVHRWLRGQGVDDLADARFDEVPPAVRTRVLAGLAACRDGVRFLVLVLPERFGGIPAEWMAVARALADLGFGVLVTASPSAAAHVDESILEWIGVER